VYGFFVGYLISFDDYEIPETDRYYYESPFGEIFSGP
jgi:hypothetical protein